jgi:ABC-type maltose transport system permease subunit
MNKANQFSNFVVGLIAVLNFFIVVWVWRELVVTQHQGKFAETSATLRYIFFYRSSAVVASFSAGWAFARLRIPGESRWPKIALIVTLVATALTAALMLENDQIVESCRR